MAEFKILASTQGSISFNYEELKAELTAKAMEYANAVYTPATIGDAKADRAKLNKLKTAINDERIRREREFMTPFTEFKQKVNEIIAILDQPIFAIDQQIHAVEQAEKKEKRDACIVIFDNVEHPNWLQFSSIENQKWYNKTTSMKAIEDEINAMVSKHVEEFKSLENYSESPFEAQEYYKNTLNFHGAMAEGHRVAEVAKMKAGMEKVEPKPEEEARWISFKALLTTSQATALNKFFKANNIKIQRGE